MQIKGKYLFTLCHLFAYLMSRVEDSECRLVANETFLILCMVLQIFIKKKYDFRFILKTRYATLNIRKRGKLMKFVMK